MSPTDESPDLAARIAAALSDNWKLATPFAPIIREVIKADPVFAEVRAALDKAVVETCRMGDDYGIPAVADACREAMAKLDALIGGGR